MKANSLRAVAAAIIASNLWLIDLREMAAANQDGPKAGGHKTTAPTGEKANADSGATITGRGTVSDENSRRLSQIREAAIKAQTLLTSGDAHGVQRTYDGEGRLLEATEFHVRFDGKRFHRIDDYSVAQKQDPVQRRILVGDESLVLESSFSQNIRPTGNETRAWDSSRYGDGEGRRIGDPRRLSAFLIDPKSWTSPDIRIDKLERGSYRHTRRYEDTVTIVHEFAPECGYNCVLREIHNKNGEGSDSKITVRWKNEKGIWYISSELTEERRAGRPSRRVEFEYKDCELNAKIPPTLFTLPALQCVPGSRIMHFQPQKVTIYNYTGLTENEAMRLGSLLEQMKSLPFRSPPIQIPNVNRLP